MTSQSQRLSIGFVYLHFAMLCVAWSLPDAVHYDIYVDKHNGTDNKACWSGIMPCATLEWGLKGLQNHTTLWLNAGEYFVKRDANVTDFEFASVHDIAIVGIKTSIKIPVTVHCNGSQIGLSFYHSSNITIRGIALVGCGALHVSTSKNFAQKEFEFERFYATLYFIYCQDVTLQSIEVNSSNGIGAVFYSTVGTNTINSTCFSNNTAKDRSWPGGGGLYIEFSYCTPQSNDKHENCSVSNVPHDYTHSAEYTISRSTFQSNNASIKNPNEYTFILPQNSTHLAFGRGGGISVFFKGNAHDNNVTITDCNLTHNEALWGAGLFVEFQDNSMNNQILILNSDISDNRVRNSTSGKDGTGGGGARLGFLFFEKTHSQRNKIAFVNVNFTHNTAYYGGGLSFYVARENASTASNQLSFKNCIWTDNTARVGTAVDLSVWHPVAEGAVVHSSFSDCVFSGNNANYANETFEGRYVGLGAVYSDSVPVIFTDHIEFTSNTQTALAAVGTGIYFSENSVTKFYNNTGRNGGAIALMGYAFIEVSDNTSLHFVKNSADLKGGAIYGHSIGEHDLISSRNCFIRYSDIYSVPQNWTATFYFEDNKAKNTINSIYVTSLLTCLWDTNKHAQEHVFCWDDQHWQYVNESVRSYCSENIATSAAIFVPQNINGTSTDNSHALSVIPGKRHSLPFRMQDDLYNVTDSTVLTAAIDDSDHSNTPLYLDSSSIYISDNSIEVHGHVGATGALKIETIDPRVISTQLKVTVQSCPPGMKFSSDQMGSNAKCTCEYHYNRMLNCFESNYTTQLQRGSWIGTLPHDHEMLVGLTPFIFGSSPYVTLPNSSHQSDLNKHTCNKINRTGVLCSKCLPGNGPAVNSKDFKCVYCTEADAHWRWVLYLLTEFLPITIFFLLVVLFNISVTSGPANAFVFFAQMTTTAMKLDGDGSIQVNDVLTNGDKADHLLRIIPYDFWNLNFFRPWLPEFCLSPYISTLELLSTGYITALYPLVLVGIFAFVVKLYSSGVRPVRWLCRPVHACFARVSRICDFQKSILHALATFLLLSYTKFTLVSFRLITSAELVHGDGSHASRRLYYAGDIEVNISSAEYYKFLIPAVIVLLTFVAVPPIVLMLPSFVHFLQRKTCWRIPDLCGGATLNQFLNTFHGCYKDGTGTEDGHDNRHDFRWFAGFYFILRVILLALFAFTYDWVIQSVLQQCVCVVALLAFVVLRPYKNDLFNKVDAVFFGNLIVLGSLSILNYHFNIVGNMQWWTFVVQYLLLIGPLMYISAVVLYYLWKRNKAVIKKLFRKCVFRFRPETEEVIQNDDDFFEDAEVAGRLGGREETGIFTQTRPSVQVNEKKPLIQNEQGPPHSRGSSEGSSRKRSNKSYGATHVSSETQTPTSDVERFEQSGVGRLHVEPKKTTLTLC